MLCWYACDFVIHYTSYKTLFMHLRNVQQLIVYISLCQSKLSYMNQTAHFYTSNPYAVGKGFWMVSRLSKEELGRGGWGSGIRWLSAYETTAKCLHQVIISRYNRRQFSREMAIASKLHILTCCCSLVPPEREAYDND